MKRILKIAGSLGLLGASVACAAEPASPPRLPIPSIRPMPGQGVMVEGAWEKAPTPLQLFNYFPERADRYGQGGVVGLRCMLDNEGYPRNCEVVSQTPPDFGFGTQAVRMMQHFKARATGADGRPVGGSSVEFNVVFRAGEGPRRYP